MRKSSLKKMGNFDFEHQMKMLTRKFYFSKVISLLLVLTFYSSYVHS